MTKTILFDLDGTLLPMDQDKFTEAYLKALAANLAPHGYEPKKLIDSIWKGTSAMIRNNGERTNEEVFWDTFAGIFGQKVYNDKRIFEDFYEGEFDKVKEICGYNSKAVKTVKMLKEEGCALILASNPIFPEVAQKKRMRWAGLDESDFESITSYENSHFCKPNVKYYTEILEKNGTEPQDCLMVGNSVSEDMAAQKIGVSVFLLTDCLINTANEDISQYAKGDFEELSAFCQRDI